MNGHRAKSAERDQRVQLEAQWRVRHQGGIGLEGQERAVPDRDALAVVVVAADVMIEPAIVFHMPSTITTARNAYITLSIRVVAEKTGPTVRRR